MREWIRYMSRKEPHRHAVLRTHVRQVDFFYNGRVEMLTFVVPYAPMRVFSHPSMGRAKRRLLLSSFNEDTRIRLRTFVLSGISPVGVVGIMKYEHRLGIEWPWFKAGVTDLLGTVGLSQLLLACLNYCWPVSTTVRLSQLLFALNYGLPSTNTVPLTLLLLLLPTTPV